MASMAADHSFEYPARCMEGIVNTPVATTFPIALPEIMPNKLLAITEILPEPPVAAGHALADLDKRLRPAGTGQYRPENSEHGQALWRTTQA